MISFSGAAGSRPEARCAEGLANAMARSQLDLPRMQNQPRPGRPVARAPQPLDSATARPSRKPRLMRQYELIDQVKEYNPNTNEDLLNRAYVYAMRAHGEQKRASGDPYISHPLQVAAILTGLKLDDATIAAALLHDTIEDTDATRAEIDRLFGPEIGRLVEGLTKLKKLDLVTREAKQAENLRKLLLAIADDVRVLLIKLADRLHNMQTIAAMPRSASFVASCCSISAIQPRERSARLSSRSVITRCASGLSSRNAKSSNSSRISCMPMRPASGA